MGLAREENRGEPTRRILGAQPYLAAVRPQPEPAAHNEARLAARNNRGRKGLGGRARLRLRRAGSLGWQLYHNPREGWVGPDRPADGQGGRKRPPCLRGSPSLSSNPPSRLPRPGRPAPLRAFGPGSRSCDVISKASALSSDTQPCPAGLGAQALFTAAWAGRGAEKRAQAPPGETAGAVALVAAPAPTPTASPRAVGLGTPPIRLRPRTPVPHGRGTFANQPGRADGCNILAFCNSRAQYKTESGR